MPGRTTPRSRPSSSTRTPPPRSSSRLWLVLLGVVALAGIVAVVASRGGEDNTANDPPAADATGSGEPAKAETRPVRVTGDALARFTSEPDSAVGRPVPQVDGASFDGTPVAIEANGRAKVIVVVAHWCPHCQREVPRLSEYLRDTPLPADVDMVTVATGTSPDRPNFPPSAWLEDEKWPGPVLADTEEGTAAAALGVSAYPFFVAADKDGNVVARTSGELTSEQFAELIRRARA